MPVRPQASPARCTSALGLGQRRGLAKQLGFWWVCMSLGVALGLGVMAPRGCEQALQAFGQREQV